MYPIKPHAIIKQIILILRLFGMWQSADKSVGKIATKTLLLIIIILLAVSLTAGAFLSVNKSDTIFLSSASIAATLMLIKLIYVLLKREDIEIFLQDICVHSMVDYNEFIEVNKKLNNFANFGYCNLISMTLAIFSFILSSLPIFSSEKRLPMNIAFPWDWKSSEMAFWMAYAFIIIAVIIAGVVTFFTIVYWYVMFNCSIKYQILGNQFRKMGVRKKDFSVSDDCESFIRDLIVLNKSCQEIKAKIKRFKSCFTNLFFAQIISSNICICGSVFALAFSSNDNVLQDIISLIVFLYNSFDIFMVMYFGNEIEISSNELTYCIFESNWIKESKIGKKSIVITTELLKRPQNLLIFKLYPLNLNTFTSIAKLTYSMFNILKNVLK